MDGVFLFMLFTLNGTLYVFRDGCKKFALLGTAEQELSDTNETLNEMTIKARLFEDMAVRLTDELRCEKKLALILKKDKKLLEAQCKDAATRADEAEVNALKKGGRKAMIKMETRIRELEFELDAESKHLRKSERTNKALILAADEDHKNHERMQDLIDQLQGKVVQKTSPCSQYQCILG